MKDLAIKLLDQTDEPEIIELGQNLLSKIDELYEVHDMLSQNILGNKYTNEVIREKLLKIVEGKRLLSRRIGR